MSMKNLRDEEAGLELAFIGWQEGGTGDHYLSAAILCGTYVGNGAGLPGRASIPPDASFKRPDELCRVSALGGPGTGDQGLGTSAGQSS